MFLSLSTFFFLRLQISAHSIVPFVYSNPWSHIHTYIHTYMIHTYIHRETTDVLSRKGCVEVVTVTVSRTETLTFVPVYALLHVLVRGVHVLCVVISAWHVGFHATERVSLVLFFLANPSVFGVGCGVGVRSGRVERSMWLSACRQWDMYECVPLPDRNEFSASPVNLPVVCGGLRE